jgi:hypothetical protein
MATNDIIKSPIEHLNSKNVMNKVLMFPRASLSPTPISFRTFLVKVEIELSENLTCHNKISLPILFT